MRPLVRCLQISAISSIPNSAYPLTIAPPLAGGIMSAKALNRHPEVWRAI